MRTLTIALAVLVVVMTPALLPAQPQAPDQPATQAPRPYLGIVPKPGTADGLTVVVVPAGPAAQAGMKSGDVITKIDDKPVKDFGELARAIREHKPGDKVKF